MKHIVDVAVLMFGLAASVWASFDEDVAAWNPALLERQR